MALKYIYIFQSKALKHLQTFTQIGIFENKPSGNPGWMPSLKAKEDAFGSLDLKDNRHFKAGVPDGSFSNQNLNLGKFWRV
jgi:hypothetical protein